jgi:hypothetical protein
VRVSQFGRNALGICAAAAMLTGCGGSQPPIAAPGAMPRTSAIASNVDRSGSRMLPEAQSGDLLYATKFNQTRMISYPKGNVVGRIAILAPVSVCSDAQGNVFFPGRDAVEEYAHGGTSPIAKLDDSGYLAYGCASDTKTGDLAVTNGYNTHGMGPGNVAIFKSASGPPRFYADPEITGYVFCTYDNAGNLFVIGYSASEPFVLAELPFGSSTFTNLTINKRILGISGEIHWDGKHLALAVVASQELLIYRLSVSGSSAKIIGTTKLLNIKLPRGTFVLQGKTVVTPVGAHATEIGFWNYPAGGSPRRIIGFVSERRPFDSLTFSVGSKNR